MMLPSSAWSSHACLSFIRLQMPRPSTLLRSTASCSTHLHPWDSCTSKTPLASSSPSRAGHCRHHSSLDTIMHSHCCSSLVMSEIRHEWLAGMILLQESPLIIIRPLVFCWSGLSCIPVFITQSSRMSCPHAIQISISFSVSFLLFALSLYQIANCAF